MSTEFDGSENDSMDEDFTGKEEISEYEKKRLRCIEENRKMLIQLGLIQPFQDQKPILDKPSFVKRRVSVKRKVKTKPESNEKLENGSANENGSKIKKRRSSRRLRGLQADDSFILENDEYEDDSANEEDHVKKVHMKRDNVYGAIEGIDVGHSWLTRLECSADGVHRPTVAGIHPGPQGAYSIALSGGYEDDVDLGESFTYTGAGGRDLKGTKTNPKNLRTAPQSKDQTLNKMNLALKTSVESGKPVRVIRGYKLQSDFAPEEGYRYDGIYYVKKWWLTPGKSGFLTYKFALQREDNQDSPPWSRLENSENV